MPLLPIDLQIVFSQMSHVGKEQAVQRGVSPQYQFVQGSEMVQKAEHDDSAVNQPREVSEGPEKVSDEEESEGKQHARSQGKSEGQRKESPEEREVFEDPDLGHHIDLLG